MRIMEEMGSQNQDEFSSLYLTPSEQSIQIKTGEKRNGLQTMENGLPGYA